MIYIEVFELVVSELLNFKGVYILGLSQEVVLHVLVLVRGAVKIARRSRGPGHTKPFLAGNESE